MPVLYMLSGVLFGTFAMVSSLAMGYPMMLALMAYPAFGASFMLLVAIGVSRRLVEATGD